MMMSVTPESVKSAFCMQIPGFCLSQGKNFLCFCNKMPFWRPFCLHFYCILIFLQEAKCHQLDPNFIADNLRKKWVLDIFPYHTFFSLIVGLHLGRHLGYIEILNDTRMASLGFFKDNICTSRINKEKS